MHLELLNKHSPYSLRKLGVAVPPRMTVPPLILTNFQSKPIGKLEMRAISPFTQASADKICHVRFATGKFFLYYMHVKDLASSTTVHVQRNPTFINIELIGKIQSYLL